MIHLHTLKSTLSFPFMYIGRTKFLQDQKQIKRKENSTYLNEQVLLITCSFSCLTKKEKDLKAKFLDDLGV